MKELITALESRGRRAAMVPVSRIGDIRADLEALGDGDVHSRYIDWMVTEAGKIGPSGLDFEARSILAVVSPSPPCEVIFHTDSGPLTALLPPAYADYDTVGGEVEREASEFLAPLGFHLSPTHIMPQKLLAARCGLGRYGRNNIFYADGLGSHASLSALYTDAPCEDGPWLPLRFMALCETCGACAAACPTGAIEAGRDIINADLCLTSMNERKTPFPDWVNPEWHECLVGCVKCQDACPANSGMGDGRAVLASFDRSETEVILSHREGEDYPESVAEKLRACGIYGYREAIPKNLAALAAGRRNALARETEGAR